MRTFLLCFIIFSCLHCAEEKSGNIDESLVGTYTIWAEEKGFADLPADRQARRKVYREKYAIQVDLKKNGTAVFTYSNGKEEKGKWRAEGQSFEFYDVQVGRKGDKSDNNQFEGAYTADGELKGNLVFKNSEQKLYLQRKE